MMAMRQYVMMATCIWIRTEFSDVPQKDLTRRCCLIHLNTLCKALHNLFKRLKQNFPLKYFLGDSVNAIEIQIWSVMIAYLLTRVISREAKDKMSFSNLVCAIRLTMFSYIDIVAMVVDPLRAWRDLKEAQRKQALAYNPKYIQLSLFDDL